MTFKSPKLLEELPFSSFIVNQLTDAVFCVGQDARFLFLNEATCCLLEHSRQELLSMTLQDIDLNFSQSAWLEQWQSLKQQGSLVVRTQYRARNDQFLVEVNFAYTKDREREYGCVVVRKLEETPEVSQESAPMELNGNGSRSKLSQEISQLKETEAQLAKSLSLVRGTLDSTAYGIIAVSYEGEVLSYNQRFVEMWEIPDSLVLAKDSQECQNFFDSKLKKPKIFRRSVWEVSRDSDTENYDILELKDGRVFAQYSKPQRLNDEIIGRVWSIWDITEFKQRTEEELQQAQADVQTTQAVEEAKQLSELRSRFLSMLCHQFRSSLNVISFSNSLLKRYINRWADDKKLPYLDNIQTAVEQIGGLLDEMVFFGRSEVRQIECEPQPTDLEKFCRELATQMQPLSDGKQQSINFVSRGNTHSVSVDKNLLHHILTNLLSNALKYSPEGSAIEFELTGEAEQIIIKVQDTGIGISEVDQHRLFEPFFRGSNVDDISGNGLGLAIASNLVDIHNGKLEVESEVGEGTTFTLILPAKQG